jgi:hypothetical protein
MVSELGSTTIDSTVQSTVSRQQAFAIAAAIGDWVKFIHTLQEES